MKELQESLDNLKKEVSQLLKENLEILEEHDIRALIFIVNYLNELYFECKIGSIKPKQKRFNHLARLLSDRCDNLVSSDLQKRLLDIERQYIEFDPI